MIAPTTASNSAAQAALPTFDSGKERYEVNMRMCLNWKVLGTLAAVGIGIWVVAPGAVAAALPALLLAACPLSMLVMMFGMKGMGGSTSQTEAGAAGEYTCPMHPQVRSGTPGRCPTCGMALVPAPAAVREQDASPARLPELKSKLAALQANQESLSLEIAALERARVAEARAGGVNR